MPLFFKSWPRTVLMLPATHINAQSNVIPSSKEIVGSASNMFLRACTWFQQKVSNRASHTDRNVFFVQGIYSHIIHTRTHTHTHTHARTDARTHTHTHMYMFSVHICTCKYICTYTQPRSLLFHAHSRSRSHMRACFKLVHIWICIVYARTISSSLSLCISRFSSMHIPFWEILQAGWWGAHYVWQLEIAHAPQAVLPSKSTYFEDIINV